MCSFDICCCCAGFGANCCGGGSGAPSRYQNTNTDQPVKQSPK